MLQEVFEANYLEAKWYEENKPITTNDFRKLWNWYKILIDKE